MSVTLPVPSEDGGVFHSLSGNAPRLPAAGIEEDEYFEYPLFYVRANPPGGGVALIPRYEPTAWSETTAWSDYLSSIPRVVSYWVHPTLS